MLSVGEGQTYGPIYEHSELQKQLRSLIYPASSNIFPLQAKCAFMWQGFVSRPNKENKFENNLDKN